MLQRRIELCGDAPRAPLQPCKRRVRPPTGGPPAQGRSTPEQAQSEKSQGVRGTESPDPSITDQRNRELRVRFFGGTTDSKLQDHKRTQLDRLYQKIVDDLDALLHAVGL